MDLNSLKGTKESTDNAIVYFSLHRRILIFGKRFCNEVQFGCEVSKIPLLVVVFISGVDKLLLKQKELSLLCYKLVQGMRASFPKSVVPP